MQRKLPIGNGILTVDNEAQAWRAPAPRKATRAATRRAPRWRWSRSSAISRGEIMARGAAAGDKDARKANQRGAARLAAVQALYQMDIAGTGLNEILAEFESHWLGREVEGEQYLPAEAAFFRDIVSRRGARAARARSADRRGAVQRAGRSSASRRCCARPCAPAPTNSTHRRDMPARVSSSPNMSTSPTPSSSATRPAWSMRCSTSWRASCARTSSTAPRVSRMAAPDDKMSAEDRLIARYFKPLATASGRAGPDRRRRLHHAAAGPRPRAQDRRHHRRRAFLSRGCRANGGEQGAAGEPVGSRRQGREARSASCCRWRCRRTSATTGSPASPRACATTPMLFGCPLFGGDTDRTPGPITISIAMFGSVPQGTMVRRAGAQAGRPRLRHRHHRRRRARARACARARRDWKLDDAQRQHLLSRYLLPQPRNALAEAVRTHASAAMDVSDGLVGDLGKLCRASPASPPTIEVARVPLSRCAPRRRSPPIPALIETALTGGDDYEIVCTVPPAKADSFRAAAQAAGVPVTEIGAVDGRARASAFLRRTASRSPSSARRSATSEVALAQAVTQMRRAIMQHAKRRGQGNAMDDMTAKKSMLAGQSSRIANFEKCTSCFRPPPGCAAARRRTCRVSPIEYGDTGAGDDIGIAHNWAAFDAIKMVPRYGVMHHAAAGRRRTVRQRYAAPIGIAPMGGPSLVWPGADLLMAKAAQRARVPYTLGVAGGATIEEIAEVAPDVFWLQLYRFCENDHAIGFDLVRRADRGRRQGAGAHARRAGAHHALARDVRRPRAEFRPNARMIYEMIDPPGLAAGAAAQRLSALRHHRPLRRPGTSTNEIIRFARQDMGGAFTWDEVARYRDAWKGPMVLKGILHPARCREGGGARRRGHLGVQPRRPPDRGAAAVDRRAAGDRCGGRQEGDRLLDSGIRRGQDVHARAGARRGRGLGRQGVPVGGGRARRRGGRTS